ncbi:MAG: hypothetical protein OIF54_09375 [Cohaesibacter sp.]|nr:hypothetical protein [Cohaesibacter sp.]
MQLLLQPAAIGPHEGREIELMHKGEKQLAHFFLPPDWKKLERLQDTQKPIPELKRIAHKEKLQDGRVLETYFLVVKGRENLVDQYLDLQEQGRGKGFDPKIERQIGALLSYKPEDIEIFIKWATLPEIRSIPNTLDPHYGQEIPLLLAGHKNIAILDDYSAPQSWQALEEIKDDFDLTIEEYEFDCRGRTNSFKILMRPCAQKYSQRLRALLKKRLQQGFDAKMEMEFWTLQGYSQREIERYSQWHQGIYEKLMMPA